MKIAYGAILLSLSLNASQTKIEYFGLYEDKCVRMWINSSPRSAEIKEALIRNMQFNMENLKGQSPIKLKSKCPSPTPTNSPMIKSVAIEISKLNEIEELEDNELIEDSKQ